MPRVRRNRQPTQATCWVFTVNDDIEDFIYMFTSGEADPNIKYCVFQLEEANRLHLQGYLELTLRKRINWLKKFVHPTAHFEGRKGTRTQARDYAMKLDTRKEGPWEFGAFREEGTPNVLIDIKTLLDKGVSLRDVAACETNFPSVIRLQRGLQWYDQTRSQNPIRVNSEVEVVVMYGLPGYGKSKLAYELEPHAYYKPSQNKWFDGYRGEKCIIFDDFNSGWFSWDLLMRLIDRYSLIIDIKTSMTHMCATKFIFTTNVHPIKWYPNKLRNWPALKRRITGVIEFTDKFVYEVKDIDDIPFSLSDIRDTRTSIDSSYEEDYAEFDSSKGKEHID